jgi:predicted nuclease of predicted toxin-antitoxin system
VIRFLLDEHVPHAIARGLRLRNVELRTATEANLLSAPDEEIATYALAEGLVVFTQDDDFLKLSAADVPHAGIVYSKQGSRSIGEIIRFLKLMSECLDETEIRGRVEFF